MQKMWMGEQTEFSKMYRGVNILYDVLISKSLGGPELTKGGKGPDYAEGSDSSVS